MTKEEFKALIDRYLSGQASAAEERLIDDFIAAQKRKEVPERDAVSEAMWASIEEGIRHSRSQRNNAARPESKTRFLQRTVWMAASILLLLVIALGMTYRGFFSPQEKKPQWVTLASPHGQKSIITLPDGSRIFLNAGSHISYPEVFLPGRREVILSGEAFFEVTENPQQPFIVRAGEVTTRVLGTSFNITAFPDRRISVTVATGKVQVEANTSPRSGDGDSTTIDRVVLLPNSQAVYSRDRGGLAVAEVDIRKYVAWKDNALFFEDTSMEEAAKILERWYNVTIIFENDKIKRCRINGKYKDQSLESVLKSFQYMYHIDFTFSEQNKVNLRGSGCNRQPVNSS